MLYAELKPLREYPLAFKTNWDRKEVMDNFFRLHKFWDVEIYQTGSQVNLMLRSSEGLWQIELLQPKNRWASNPKKASREQVRFEKIIRQVMALRAQKNHAFDVYQAQLWQKEFAQTSAVALETAGLPKGMVRNSFKIRSMGRFAWASPQVLDTTMLLNVVVADQGMASIDVAQFVVGFKKPDGVQVFQVPLGNAVQALQTREFALNLDPSRVAFFAAKDTDGRFYSLTGDAFRKLEIKSNSLMYLPLQIQADVVYTDESLRALLNLPKKKSNP
jgi:hypothetical protein